MASKILVYLDLIFIAFPTSAFFFSLKAGKPPVQIQSLCGCFAIILWYIAVHSLPQRHP